LVPEVIKPVEVMVPDALIDVAPLIAPLTMDKVPSLMVLPVPTVSPPEEIGRAHV
jgi:hypothetical protein